MTDVISAVLILSFLGLMPACQDSVTYRRPIKATKPVAEASSADSRENGDAVADGAASGPDEGAEQPSAEGEEAEDAAAVLPSTMMATGEVSISTLIVAPAQAGRYAPDRLQAIWISDQNDQHLLSLSANPGRRPQHLRRWRSVNGDEVDGFTGATLSDFAATPTMLVWNLKDKNGAQVNFGDYKIWFEMTQSNTNDNFVDGDPGYALYGLSFSLKPEGFILNDNLHPSFTNISLIHTP